MRSFLKDQYEVNTGEKVRTKPDNALTFPGCLLDQVNIHGIQILVQQIMQIKFKQMN